MYKSRCTVIRTFEVFFWKNYCGALGLRLSAIFTTIDLHPLYFEVHIFLAPPICLKMPKYAIFGLFWSFHFKDTPKVGVHREKFNIGNVGHFFLVTYIFVGTRSFHFRNISPLKIFHCHRQRHLHRHSTHFLKFG